MRSGIVFFCYFNPFFTDDYEEMLNQPGIDIVDICSPDNWHCKHAVKAAKHGYHILCQKPLALSLEEARRIKEAVNKAGIKFMAIMVSRWKLRHIKMKELITQGVIGRPVFIRYQVKGAFYSYPENSFYRKRESLGQFLHNGVHFVDECCDFLEALPRKVYGVTTTYFAPENTLETPNYHLAHMEMSGGQIVEIEYNELLVTPPATEVLLNILVVGTKGTMEFSDQENKSLLHYRGGENKSIEIPYRDTEFVRALGYFLDCIRENHNPVISIETSIKTLEACLGVIESASIGKPVVLNGKNVRI